MIIISIIFVSFILIFLNYFFYKKKQTVKKIVQETKEISNTNLVYETQNQSLITKNDLLKKKNQQLEKELLNYLAIKNSQKKHLHSIKKQMEQNLKRTSPTLLEWQIIYSKIDKLTADKEENEWNDFKQKIDKLHPDFFKSLTLKHPDLNERELMHCAYILIGMNVNKVAETLFVSIRTVDSARYRIKKKLGLDRTVSLKVYIKNIGKSNGLHELNNLTISH